MKILIGFIIFWIFAIVWAILLMIKKIDKLENNIKELKND